MRYHGARPGGGARAARGRDRDPRLGDAVARERVQRRARALHAAACCPSARRRGRCPRSTVVDLRRHPPGPGRPAVGAAGGGAGRRRWRRRAEHPVPQPARLLDASLLCHACGHVVRCPSCAVSLTYHRGRVAPGLPLLRPRCSTCPSAARRARAAARAHGHRHRARRGDRARALPRRARRAARPRHRRRPGGGGQRARRDPGAHARRRDRRPGRHADGDQGPRLPGRDAGRRAAARSDDEPARLPRRRADVPAARAGGGAGRAAAIAPGA